MARQQVPELANLIEGKEETAPPEIRKVEPPAFNGLFQTRVKPIAVPHKTPDPYRLRSSSYKKDESLRHNLRDAGLGAGGGLRLENGTT